MRGRKIVVLVAGLAAGAAGIALACGPDFPLQLLDDRAGSLQGVPANSFRWEVQQLVPVSDAPFRDSYAGRESVEAKQYSVDQRAVLGAMRRATDGEAAYAAGERLPSDIRSYTAGAVDFLAATKGEAWSPAQRLMMLRRAEARFAALSDDAGAGGVALWGAYMLGRTRIALLIGTGGCDINPARAALQRTRALAGQGLPDPLALALASYGEEARLHLHLAIPRSPCGAPAAEELETMVHLYAQQAGQGSRSGIGSVQLAMTTFLDDQRLLSLAMSRPLLRQMMAAYLLYSSWPVYDDAIDASLPLSTPDGRARRYLAAVEALGVKKLDYADRLAALAYRNGLYDLAGRFAGYADTSLAAWVKAKLALRAGDRDKAAAFYARAMYGDGSLEPALAARMQGERGVLALASGDFAQALAALYAASPRYWADAAYLAERVVTTDELKQFVDASVPRADPQPPPNDWGLSPDVPSIQLRMLLARRLVREGRAVEAVSYFPEHWRHPWPNKEIPLRQQATDYVAALKAGSDAWTRIGQAEGWFAAARLARYSGMELMGYEEAPDFFIFNGSYDVGAGRDAVTPGGLVTADEAKRFEATTPDSDLRFHYRYLAVAHAIEAADRLPPRSQAFAAVLCHAAGWMLSSDADEQAQALYQRYVRQGALLPWAAHFGRDCPAPDFAGARKRQWLDYWDQVRHGLRRHAFVLGIASGAALMAAAFWLLQRSRRPA